MNDRALCGLHSQTFFPLLNEFNDFVNEAEANMADEATRCTQTIENMREKARQLQDELAKMAEFVRPARKRKFCG